MSQAPKKRSSASDRPVEYRLLLTSTMCLVALGALMVFSASSAKGVLEGTGAVGDSATFLKQTLMWAAVGLVVMRIASVRGVRVARALTPFLVAGSIFLLIAVMMPGFGQTINGAQRWIAAGPIQFQPSELAKVSVILYAAHLLAQRPKRARSLRELAPALAVSGVILLLVAAQPDLGTILATGMGLTCLLLIAGVRPATLAPLAGVAAIGLLGLVATNPYQQERLTGFLHPNADIENAGFQSNQAKIAIGSGGVLGVGLGESVQKASYLPEAHTDMIAAVFGEEMGFAGFVILIGLYGVFGYAGLSTAMRARDRYSKLLAAGLTSMILGQAVINLFAVLGLAPLTGVPLPFVSYGGTSLVMTLACAGLLLNIASGRQAAGARSGSATGARSASGEGRRATATGGSNARLRVVDGGGERDRLRRATATGRDRRRRNGGSRRAGNSGRRRAPR